MGIVTSFQNILDNVFIPLFEVTIDPSSHPQLHLFLMQVVGFDLVDDESKPERRQTKHMPRPAEWTNEFNPAYSYYAYYCYANFIILNKVWKLSACDLCEIARNSVYQSGFSHVTKLHWFGDKYFVRGPEGNDIHKTNVPNSRISFRHETWKEDIQYIYSGKARFPEEIEL